MTIKMTLLAAVATIALPAAMAGAQVVPPAGPTPPPSTGTTVPPAEETATPTTNTATEDAQDEPGRPAPATTPDPLNENAEPATHPATHAHTAPPQQPQAVAPAPAPAQTQTQAQAPTTAPAPAGPTVLATAADITTGAAVVDQTGGSVGTIESVDATGAVVATGTVRAKLPLTSFGRNNRGLVISMTRAQLEAAAQQAAPTPS